jgi:hypothetical protein
MSARAPGLAEGNAIALPMPVAAPVTIATLAFELASHSNQ